MKVGDIILRKDEASCEEYLEWITEGESKTRHGDENEHRTDPSVQKHTKLATENVQCLALKNLFTGDQKRQNYREFFFLSCSSPEKTRRPNLVLKQSDGEEQNW